jgi:hypothetical protein
LADGEVAEGGKKTGELELMGDGFIGVLKGLWNIDRSGFVDE